MQQRCFCSAPADVIRHQLSAADGWVNLKCPPPKQNRMKGKELKMQHAFCRNETPVKTLSLSTEEQFHWPLLLLVWILRLGSLPGLAGGYVIQLAHFWCPGVAKVYTSFGSPAPWTAESWDPRVHIDLRVSLIPNMPRTEKDRPGAEWFHFPVLQLSQMQNSDKGFLEIFAKCITTWLCRS